MTDSVFPVTVIRDARLKRARAQVAWRRPNNPVALVSYRREHRATVKRTTWPSGRNGLITRGKIGDYSTTILG